ncbi:hypothetical protein ABW20_dc0100949 [Dactylellina cionopaga]|nr:hypothetical protein ABW20_dc0100949 [Dactylellina cionopaga]
MKFTSSILAATALLINTVFAAPAVPEEKATGPAPAKEIPFIKVYPSGYFNDTQVAPTTDSKLSKRWAVRVTKCIQNNGGGACDFLTFTDSSQCQNLQYQLVAYVNTYAAGRAGCILYHGYGCTDQATNAFYGEINISPNPYASMNCWPA